MPERYFEDQYDDETILLLFRRHIVVMRQHLIIATVLIVLASALVLVWPVPTWKVFWLSLLGGCLAGVLVVFYGWVGWYYSVFVVTDKRFIQITRQGFFNKSVVDLTLDQIQMVNYQVKGFQETLLGFGTISVQTMVGELTVKTVARPAKIQKKLGRILKEHAQTSLGDQDDS